MRPARTPSSRRTGAAEDRQGNDQGQRRRAGRDDVRISRHGPLVSDAINANNAESDRDAETGATRTAGVPLDGARRGGLDDHGVSAAERGEELDRVHRRAAAIRRPVAELRLCGRRRPHRLLRARPDSDPRLRRRLDAGRGLDRRDGVDRLDSVRGAPPRLRPAVAFHRHRQPPAGAAGLPALPRRSSIPSRIRAQRITELAAAKNGRFTPEDFRAIQADTFSTQAKPCCRCSCRRVHPEATIDRAPSSCFAAGTSTHAADSAEPAILQAWFLALAPIARRRRAGTGPDSKATSAGSPSSRASSSTR